MDKKLYRNEKDKMIGGVCAGLADYFDIDPTIIRVLFVVFGLWGPAVLIYIIMWIIVPKK